MRRPTPPVTAAAGARAPEARRRARARATARMLGRVAAGVVLTLVVGAAGSGMTLFVTAAPPGVHGSTARVEPDVGQAVVTWPEGPAAAAFAVRGIEGAAGSSGSGAPLPMASIAKLLLALVVLEKRPLAPGELGPPITLDEDDVAHLREGVSQGASVLPVAAGDQLSQRQLLEAAMVISASNAAMTLADWAFGSQEGYLDAARRWLGDRSIEGISPADASGLSSRGTATAPALLELMRALDEVPALAEISGLRTTTLPRLGQVDNSNRSLGSVGIDSGKTGSLRLHGQTILVGADHEVGDDTVRIHAVLLGVPPSIDRDAAIAALVQSAGANLQMRELVPTGAVAAVYRADWGGALSLVTAAPIRAVHWAGQSVAIAIDVPTKASSAARAAGVLHVTVGHDTLSVPLEARGALEPPDLEWRLANPSAVLEWAIDDLEDVAAAAR